MPAASSLNAARRAGDLAAVSGGDPVDLLVVGGGVTGCGAALDAAARGLSVCLIEANDLAFGTSRWSSKLVHGGLRYLASGDVGLAMQSATERDILLRTVAPHLIRPLPQLVPLHREVSTGKAAVTMTGLRAGDVLRRAARTPSALLPRPRRIGSTQALRSAPGLRRDGLRGALLSYDGQLTDDARLVVALARTAAAHGARVLTRVRALALDGRGAEVRDEVGDEVLRLNARAVLNATGVWAGGLVGNLALRPSRGSHLILAADRVRIGNHALTIPVPGSRNRFGLLLPQLDGRVYLGLTDEPMDGPVPDVPDVPDSDIDELLDLASGALAEPLHRKDVLGAFAGLRPLVGAPDGAGARSADLSRRHVVHTDPSGVISVIGGKLTTYRKMAAEAVDAALAAARLPTGRSTTHRIGLVGAAPPGNLSTLDVHPRLVAKYGTEAVHLAALAERYPALAVPVADGLTGAEVVWAVRTEGALSADDVLDRRSRVGLVTADRAAAADEVHRLVAEELESSLNQ